MKIIVHLFLFVVILFSCKIQSQENKVKWINFEQLQDSLAKKPKKVFINFYTDWCVYCKKMNNVTFRQNNIIHLLNTEYYAVKMNAESKDTISFDKRKFVNNQIGKSRRPIHQIPLLLANRKDKPFTLPVNIILGKNFKIKGRYFEFLSSKKLLEILNN